MAHHPLQLGITFFGDSYKAEIFRSFPTFNYKNFTKIFFKKYVPLCNYDIILKGCAPFFNWCIYAVIVTGFVCLLLSMFFIFDWCILEIIYLFWRCQHYQFFLYDVIMTSHKIQDFTKRMNMMLKIYFIVSNNFSFHWCHCIVFSFCFLFHFGFHLLAYVSSKLSVFFFSFFNWNSLHARLNSRYEAWSY